MPHSTAHLGAIAPPPATAQIAARSSWQDRSAPRPRPKCSARPAHTPPLCCDRPRWRRPCLPPRPAARRPAGRAIAGPSVGFSLCGEHLHQSIAVGSPASAVRRSQRSTARFRPRFALWHASGGRVRASLAGSLPRSRRHEAGQGQVSPQAARSFGSLREISSSTPAICRVSLRATRSTCSATIRA